MKDGNDVHPTKYPLAIPFKSHIPIIEQHFVIVPGSKKDRTIELLQKLPLMRYQGSKYDEVAVLLYGTAHKEQKSE